MMAMKTWDAKLSELLQMLDDEGGLTAWEGEFLRSLSAQDERISWDYWEPDLRQDATLTEIYNRRVLGIK